MALPTARWRPLIDRATIAAQLPWWRGYSPGEWLEAQVMQESSGDPTATRFEAHLKGRREDCTSWGLLQVMGFNIRALYSIPRDVPADFSSIR